MTGRADARGDGGPPRRSTPPATPPAVTPALSTAPVAARLAGVDTATVRADATQNIRGGAALLASYQRAIGAPVSAGPDGWYAAVARYSGAADTVVAVPGTGPERIRQMHWDPGPYWDWAHYFDLLGRRWKDWVTTGPAFVMIKPDFATNRPAFVGRDATAPTAPCPARGSSDVVLYSEPRTDAPRVRDVGLRPDGAPHTMHVSDIGPRASTGQIYAVAERRDGWTAIWYLGQKAWFHDSAGAPTTVPRPGVVATPAPGRETVPVYGVARPDASEYPADTTPPVVTPLPYTFVAGQRYAVGATVQAEHHWAKQFDAGKHVVVRGKETYIQVGSCSRSGMPGQ